MANNLGEPIAGRPVEAATLEEIMMLFDALPVTLRSFLNEASAEWSVPSVMRLYRYLGAEGALNLRRAEDSAWRRQAYAQRGLTPP